MTKRMAIIVKGKDNTEKEKKVALSLGLHINQAIERDTDRMIEFLPKPLFGNWEPGEITIVSESDTPMQQQIDLAISQQASYVFFYYLGHGNADGDGNVLMQFICEDGHTKPSEELFVRELQSMLEQKNVSNYLVIANCCRSSAEGNPFNLTLNEFPLEAFNAVQVSANNFRQHTEAMVNQKVIVYTTSSGGRALFGETGNLFTESFFRSIYNWMISSGTTGPLYIEDLIDRTNNEMEKWRSKSGGRKLYRRRRFQNTYLHRQTFPLNGRTGMIFFDKLETDKSACSLSPWFAFSGRPFEMDPLS